MPDGMREKLLNLGASNQLFTIRLGEDCDLHLEHTIVDAKFYGVASKENLSQQYEAKIWLVEDERVVKYREIIKEKSSSLGVLSAPKLSFQTSKFKGKVLTKKEMGFGFGFKKPADPSSFGKAYRYDFDVNKIRGPVKELVEANGWKFEQIIMDYKPSKGAAGAPGQASFCSQCGSRLEPGSGFCTNCGNKVS
jgi:hypothetical protein